MIRNIKIHNIFDSIEISKFVELNKCTHLKKIMKKMYLSVIYDFLKVDGFRKIKV
jgi:hypothetical protein